MGRWAVPAVVVLAACPYPYITREVHEDHLAALGVDSDAAVDSDPVGETDPGDSDAGDSDVGDSDGSDDTDPACGDVEVPGDHLDGDCDGFELCYKDADADGVGSDATVLSADLGCAASGLATQSDDCDDNDADRFPGHAERCDGEDQDCSPDPVAVCLPTAATWVESLGTVGKVFPTGGGLGTRLIGGHYEVDAFGEVAVSALPDRVAGESDPPRAVAVFAWNSGNAKWNERLRTNLLDFALAQTRVGRLAAGVSGAELLASNGSDSVLSSAAADLPPPPYGGLSGYASFAGSVAIPVEYSGGDSSWIVAAGVRFIKAGVEDPPRVLLARAAMTTGVAPEYAWVAPSSYSSGSWGTQLAVIRGSGDPFLLIAGVDEGGGNIIDAVKVTPDTFIEGDEWDAWRYRKGMSGTLDRLFGCDTDGDGEEEVVSVDLPPSGLGSLEGYVRVYPPPGRVSVADLAPLYSIRLTPGAAGHIAATCGDFDGNGIGDIVTGLTFASGESSTTTETGRVLVFLGRRGGRTADLTRDDADVRWSSATASSGIGSSVASLPDISGDGIHEILLGMPSYAPLSSPGDPGGFAVIYGRSAQ